MMASEMDYRALIHRASEAVAVLDVDTGDVLDINSKAVEMSGYTVSEIRRMGPVVLTIDQRPYSLEDLVPRLNKAVRGEPQVFEWLAKHKSGRSYWVEISLTCAPIGDKNGLLLIGRDIARRKEMEQQLLRAQHLEMVRKMCGAVAHNLNNLLAPFLGYSELIKRLLPDDHIASRYCEAMLGMGPQMARISENLLIISMRDRFGKEPVSLNGLVEQHLKQLPELPPALTVQLDLAAGLPDVSGSAARLRQVLSNLMANAREAMDDAGVLEIKTEPFHVDAPWGPYGRVESGEYARLQVSDTGPGIPAEIKDQIFEVFFTTKVTGKSRGSGLGLSVVQAIIDDHCGYVDVHSEAGKGATFSVYLPVAPPREELRML